MIEIQGKFLDLLLKIMKPSFVCPYCKKKGIVLYQKQPGSRRKYLFSRQPKKRKQNDTCYYCNRRVIGSPIIYVINLLIAIIMVSVFYKMGLFTGTQGQLYFLLYLVLYFFICEIVIVIMPVSKAEKQ